MGYRYTHCPHCGVSLLGDPIPDDIRHYYGTVTHWRREVVVTVPAVYDGGLYYKCPDCHGTWHRWPEGSRLWTLARPYVPEDPPVKTRKRNL